MGRTPAFMHLIFLRLHFEFKVLREHRLKTRQEKISNVKCLEESGAAGLVLSEGSVL